MAFVKKTWKDRISEFPTRRRLTKSNGDSELVTVAREEGTVSQEGDAFSAENMNDLERRVDDAISEINSNLSNLITGTITRGNTSITLTDSRIKSNSIIDIYFENKVLSPNNVTVTDGSITIEIESQDSDTNVGVRCL